MICLFIKIQDVFQIPSDSNCNCNWLLGTDWLKPSVAPGYIIVWCHLLPVGIRICHHHRIQPCPQVKVIFQYLRPDAPVSLFFHSFTQVHLLIDGSVDGQYITVVLCCYQERFSFFLKPCLSFLMWDSPVAKSVHRVVFLSIFVHRLFLSSSTGCTCSAVLPLIYTVDACVGCIFSDGCNQSSSTLVYAIFELSRSINTIFNAGTSSYFFFSWHIQSVCVVFRL